MCVSFFFCSSGGQLAISDAVDDASKHNSGFLTRKKNSPSGSSLTSPKTSAQRASISPRQGPSPAIDSNCRPPDALRRVQNRISCLYFNNMGFRCMLKYRRDDGRRGSNKFFAVFWVSVVAPFHSNRFLVAFFFNSFTIFWIISPLRSFSPSYVGESLYAPAIFNALLIAWPSEIMLFDKSKRVKPFSDCSILFTRFDGSRESLLSSEGGEDGFWRIA
mmetsp:Transcript_21796/g.51433  ORF Transcript_21796/g.51433 Transcript_21796/m.51433 type:complete len:218 (+) Transcript_21796:38-691(+)